MQGLRIAPGLPFPSDLLKSQVYPGSDQFVDDMQRRIEGANRRLWDPQGNRRALFG